MGQSILSPLPPTLAIPEPVRVAEPKERHEPAIADQASPDSLFSKFLKRREPADATTREARPASNNRAKPADAKPEASKTNSKAAHRTSISSADEAADGDTDTDDQIEAVADAEDSAPPEETKSETADVASDADADDQATSSDPAKDTNVESMLMGFFAGQVPLAIQAPGGSGDAATAATATSAPAPIPTGINASPQPLATDPHISPADEANLAPAGKAADDFNALLAHAVAAPSSAAPSSIAVPASPQAATEIAATTPSATSASMQAADPKAPILDAQAKPLTATTDDAADDDEIAGKTDDAVQTLTLPRRLGRQEPVLPAAAPTPDSHSAAGPTAIAAGPVAALSQTAVRFAANIASVTEAKTAETDAVSATAETSGATALPGAPGVASGTAAVPTKFELGGGTPNAAAADQILAHVATLPKGRGTQFSLQLEPLHLGKVEVVMSIQHDGALHMQIQAESRETLAALQRDASQLERSLQDLGLKTDSGSLQFSLKQDGQQNPAFAQFEQNAQGGNGQNGMRRSAGLDDTQQTRPLGTVAYRPVAQADGLDIHV